MSGHNSYRSTRQIVLMLVILFLADGIVSLINAVCESLEMDLLQEISAGGDPSPERIQENYDRQQSMGLTQLGVRIMVLIVFLIWISRANKNGSSLGAVDMEFSPALCVAGFFIPIVNLYWPYKAVKEIWKASHPDYLHDWHQATTSPVLGWWWILWLTRNFAYAVAGRLSWHTESAPQLLIAARIRLFADLIDLPTIALAIAVVHKIQSMQERKYELLLNAPDVLPAEAP
jgi:hypothetical protein